MFKVYKEKLMIDTKSIDNKELLKLIEMDVSKDKSVALKCLLYIFFRFNLSEDNPLKDIAYNEKRSEALFRAFGDKFYDITKELGEDMAKQIAIASKAYADEYINDFQRDILTYDKKMDQLREMLEKTKPKIVKNENEKTGGISYNSNTDIINKTLASIITIIHTKAQVMTRQFEGSVPKHLRGGLSPLSKGNIKT